MTTNNGIQREVDDDEEVEQVEQAELILNDVTHQSHVLNSLDTMRKNKTFCDVILKVGKSELYGHRAVLASVSPQLMELFSTDENGKNGNQLDHVITFKLNGAYDETALRILIDYAYTSQLKVPGSEVRSVYRTACNLKMEHVAEECANHMIKHLSVDNCIDIRSLPAISRSTSLRKPIDSFIVANFGLIRESASFLVLPCAQIEILNQTKQEMDLSCGNSLCELVIDWVKRAYPNNVLEQFTHRNHMLYLASDNTLQDCMQLPTGDASETQMVQDYKKLAQKTIGGNASKIVHRGGQLHPAKPRVVVFNGECNQEIDANWSVVAVNKVAEHMFLGLVCLNDRLARLSIMLRLNCENPEIVVCSPLGSRRSSLESLPDTYCSLSNMFSGKCAAGCVTLDDTLVVCGGYDRVECIKSVECYDPSNNTWEKLPSMLEARGRFNATVCNGMIYAVGGSNGTTELATVECYNPLKKKWKHVAPLPLARSNAGVCEMLNRIYCIGGWNGQVGIRQCDMYDPATDSWSSIAPLNTGRYQAAVCALNGLLYAVGGCDAWNCLNSVECYQPTTNSWTILKPLITARRGSGLALFQGKLYVVGGSDGSHSLDSTEIYDPESGEWSLGATLTTPRANVGLTVLKNRLYAVGGFSGKKFLNTIEFLDTQTNTWTHFSVKCTPAPTLSSPSSSSSIMSQDPYQDE